MRTPEEIVKTRNVLRASKELAEEMAKRTLEKGSKVTSSQELLDIKTKLAEEIEVMHLYGKLSEAFCWLVGCSCPAGRNFTDMLKSTSKQLADIGVKIPCSPKEIKQATQQQNTFFSKN